MRFCHRVGVEVELCRTERSAIAKYFRIHKTNRYYRGNLSGQHDMDTPKNLILIVDDVEQNVAVLSQVLRNTGYQVMAAFSGEQALKMLEKRLPDLILLDVMMPGIDGFETCRQIKANERTADIPVIFLSALSESDTKVKGLEIGGVDYISKPFHEAEVVARVGVHLKIRNLERERLLHIEQLQYMNSEKDRLVQIVSHDLRSPLSGISGLVQILSEGNEAHNPDTVKYFSKIILQSTDTLLSLVNDILDLAKLESDKVDLNSIEFDLKEALIGIIELQKFIASSKGLYLKLNTDADIIKVMADKPKLLQVMNNLISNSVKFTKTGGVQINVWSKYSGDDNNGNITIEVKDTGIGIPDELLPHLFEKFGKHQRRGTNDEKGTGLGMPIVKRFIELHGGEIDVISKINEGTTVTLSLPIAIPESTLSELQTV